MNKGCFVFSLRAVRYALCLVRRLPLSLSVVASVLLAAVLLATVSSAEAQQKNKIYRVAYLAPGQGIGSHEEAFRQALRGLGYVEGENLVIEWRHAGGKIDRYPELAADLVRLNVDCILAVGVEATRAAMQATTTIPIVMGDSDDDPVRQGFIANLAQPGGNVTGVTSISSDLAGKRLELLKETLPKLSRVAILLGNLKSQAAAGHLRETETAARGFGVELRSLEVPTSEAIENAFQGARKWRADALIAVMVGGMSRHLPQLTNLAIKNRMPVMYTQSRAVPEGGLISYATDTHELRRRAAIYVDRILKGAKPADLPVEQPTKFELLINLKTAKQIGVTFPETVLYRADRMIR